MSDLPLKKYNIYQVGLPCPFFATSITISLEKYLSQSHIMYVTVKLILLDNPHMIIHSHKFIQLLLNVKSWNYNLGDWRIFPSLTFQHALWLISVLSGVRQLLQAVEEIHWLQKDSLAERSVITLWRFSGHMSCGMPDFSGSNLSYIQRYANLTTCFGLLYTAPDKM